MAHIYQKKIGNLYDAISEEFDKTRIRPDSFLETLINRGFANKSRLLLDNGCGNCRNSNVFSQRNTLIAGDISRKMLKQCMKNTREKKVYHVQYALTHLPFRSSVFNGILCIAVIHHLKENGAEKALMEMSRVLEEGGWMLVSSWSIKILRNKRFLSKTEKTDENYFLISWGVHKRFYFLMDVKTLRAMCRKTGFTDADALEYGMNNYCLMDRRKRKD
ncbi:MAG: methyltransferase domain-containing protein [Thermoproteota archaeon]